MLARALSAVAVAAAVLSAAAHAQPCPTWTLPQPAADNPNNQIHALVKFNDKLVARGTFTTAGGAPASGIAEFNGSTWTPFGNVTLNFGFSTRYSMAAWGGKLYATGSFPGGPLTGRGAVWTGSTFSEWPATGPSFNSRVPRALFALGDGTFLVEGSFVYYDNDGNLIRKRRLVKYDGSSFIPLSTTQYGPRVSADEDLVQSVLQALNYDGKIVMRGVGALSTGDAWNTNNVPCPSGFCLFDGTSFTPLPAPALNGSVVDMAVFNDELYVIGPFTAAVGNPTPLRNIARYDRATQNWAKCGNGLSDQMTLIVTANDSTGERLHLFRTGSATVTAYNDPNSTTTDTVTFRYSVQYDGVRYQADGASLSSGLSGDAKDALTYDPGTGPALFVGGQNLFSAGFTGASTFARRGRSPSPDTDGDGLLDVWEQNGIDIDCNGTVDLDLPALSADWRKKDIFVEVDSMNGRSPAPGTLNPVIDAFADCPASLANNPDGQQGINLHLIIDPADQSIPMQSFPFAWANFHPLKNERFGNAADRAGPNRTAILDAKRLVFRYCMFADRYGDPPYSSGLAEIVGNDFMVTLGTWETPGGTPQQQAATFMHELGHTLGLLHGGHQKGPQFNYKPNYHSIMNYSWQLAVNIPGWRLDYSRIALPNLDENNLDENAGLGEPFGGETMVGPPPGYLVPMDGPVDYDENGLFDSGVTFDLNFAKAGSVASLNVLQGCEDWSRLKYNFRNSPNIASGVSPESMIGEETMNAQLDAEINALATPPACPADLGIAGGLPGTDGTLDDNDFIAFITYFFASDPHADLGIAGGLPGTDSLFDNNDFIAFITYFFEGC